MKYVSLDLETTGLNPEHCQVLEVGMVLEDTENLRPLNELPHISVLFKNPVIVGEYEGLRMNEELLAACEETGDPPEKAWHAVLVQLQCWGIDQYNRGNLAGKNIGTFDWQFLPPHIRHCFRHRVIDPGSVLVDWSKDKLPNLKQLLGEGREVKHRAVDDARDVIEVLRRSYG